MKLFAASVYIVLIIFLSSHQSLAQLTAGDSLFYRTTINNTLALYHQSTGDQSRLYNGSQYAGYNFPFKEGQPFFGSDQPIMGSIIYDNIFYDSVLLQYDEVREAVIFKDINHTIQLINERINQFNLGDQTFIRIITDSLSGNAISTGFYNQLYKGNISILKKETKNIQEQIINNQGLQRYIVVQASYYLLKANKYYPIKSKADVFNVLKDKKKEIQEYIRANNLKFRKHKDVFFTKVAAYYDSITR